MRALERRDGPFELRQPGERLERRRVGDRDVERARPESRSEACSGPLPRVVEPGHQNRLPRTIRSTIDGIVAEKKLSAGEFVNQEGYIVTLSRLDPLHVEVFLPVIYYKQVHVGMAGNVHPAPPLDNVYAATISVVDHVFDPASGTSA